MSQRVASIFAEIGLDASGFDKGATTLGGAVGDLVSSISAMHPAAAIAISAVQQLGTFLMESAAIADEAARVHARTEAVIRATGGAAGLTAGEVSALASEMQRLSGIDDEAAESAAAILLSFRNVGEDVFPQAMNAAADLAAVMGTDLNGAITMIGKALNDPIQGIGALRRVGVQLSNEQEAQVRAFMAVNDVASAQAVIMGELNAEFGGAAQAMFQAGNRSEAVAGAMENLKEAIGMMALPAVQSFNQALADGINGLNAWARNAELLNSIETEQERILQSVGLSMELNANQTKGNTEAVNGLYAANKDASTAAFELARIQLYGAGAMERGEATAEDLTARITELGTALGMTPEQIQATVDIVINGREDLNQVQQELAAFSNEQQFGFILDFQASSDRFKEQKESILSDMEGLKDKIIETQEQMASGEMGAEEGNEQIAGYREEIVGLTGDLNQATQAQQKWAKQFALSMLQARLSQGGLTNAEFDTLLSFGQELGVIDPETSAAVQEMLDAVSSVEADSLGDAVNDIKYLVSQDGRTITIYVEQQTTTTDTGTGTSGTDRSADGMKTSTGETVVFNNYGTVEISGASMSQDLLAIMRA